MILQNVFFLKENNWPVVLLKVIVPVKNNSRVDNNR